MGRKEDLEKLIMGSYRIIRENDQQIPLVGPKERLLLQGGNDAQWSYIRNYLTEYTALCERLRLQTPEDIVQIAAGSFPDLADRLITAPSRGKPAPPPAHPLVKLPTSPETPSASQMPPLVPPSAPVRVRDSSSAKVSPFRMNYHLVRQFAPMDGDTLTQFVVTFGNRGDADFSQVDVVTHVCLVLDVSGSMDVPDKYPYLLQAIPYVIQTLSDNDWLSIVLFSSRSELAWSKGIGSCRGHEQDAIERVDQSGVKFGRTYLAPALQIAIEEIRRFCQSCPEAVTRLYILTDGQLHDTPECYRLNPELRHLEIEVNSYGFGQDFAEETMRQIMEGCQGGRVKSVSNPQTLWKSFYHVGKVARNIVATDAELRVTFSPTVTPGDAFRFEPGTHWFGTVEDHTKRFHTSIGGLEKERVYVYAFEARLYPSTDEREHIATAALRYSFQGEQCVLKKGIFVDRTREQWRCDQVDKEVEYLFLVLEGLRTDDPQSTLASLQARLRILQEEGGDPAQIELLQKAIMKLNSEGTLEGLSEFELRRLRADAGTSRYLK
jgi:hypothetical protein